MLSSAVGRSSVIRRREFGLDAAFDRIGELATALGEQLDAVVGPHIVRCRDDRSDRVAALRFERDLWRWSDAEANHLEPFGSEPRTQRTIDLFGGLACVAAHHDRGDTIGTEHTRSGATQAGGELGGQFAERDTTNSVGAELHREDPISAW